MKILRYDDERIGVLGKDAQVVDISDLIGCRQERGPQRSMEFLLENFEGLRSEIEGRAANFDGVRLSEVSLKAPMPRPSKCLAAFLNYLDRGHTSAEFLPNEFFYKAPDLVGPGGLIELRDIEPVKQVAPEAELAFVMGKRCKNVAERDAMDHVFGYMPFFDISARGLIRRSLFLAKGQNSFAAAGPWLTTRDEIEDPHDLVVRSWVDGELRQNFNTSAMAHRIPNQIAWLSRFIQLEPGDVIATGTYHEGLGPINVGETLEIEIERLGRARFFVGGDMPVRKGRGPDARKPDPLPTGFTMTPV